MLNFGTVYTFIKSEFLRNEHGDPLFSFYSTRDMMSFVCAKCTKKSVRWKNCHIRPPFCSFNNLLGHREFSLSLPVHTYTDRHSLQQ